MLKPSKINMLRTGLIRQIALYKKVKVLSEIEKELLANRETLQKVMQGLPNKLVLLKQIEDLDIPLKEIKEEWMALHVKGALMPEDVLGFLKDLEIIIHEVIQLDLVNQAMMQNYSSEGDIGRGPRTIATNDALRAKNAYGLKNNE